jgi:hypothetical protein
VTALADLQRRSQLIAETLRMNEFYRFVPRPDCPEEHDQQTSWYWSKAAVAVCVAGNRSGKTHSAAAKLVRLVTRDVPPPSPDATFLVVSDSYEQVINICWKEKLSRMLPDDIVDWDRIQWHKKSMGMPHTVPLKPWPGNPKNNWLIEFRSEDQGRRKFQGRTYYGLWVSEQLPWEVVEEIRRGMVDHPIPGACFLEFTPLDPDITIGLEERMEASTRGDPSVAGWEFFQLNSEKNQHINQEAMRAYLASVSPELRETRRIGKLASFAGAVYPNWDPGIHYLNARQWREVTGFWPPERGQDLRVSCPPGSLFRRGIDWGESLEHAFACVWGFVVNGSWYVFDELVDNTRIDYDWRAKEVIDRYAWPDTDARFGQTYGDPSRPYLISLFGQKGISMQGAASSLEGHETLRRLMECRSTGLTDESGREVKRPNLFLLRPDPEDPDSPGCPVTARQIWKLRYLRSVKPGRIDTRLNRNKAANEVQKWDDDAENACRYMIHSDTPFDQTAPDSLSTLVGSERYGLHLRKSFRDRSRGI